MRHARIFGITALAALAIGAAAHAQSDSEPAASQSTATPLPDTPPAATAPIGAAVMADLAATQWGDAKKGATLATPCAACHGADGNPADPQYPRIAGQSERYISQQLALFKANQRTGGMAAVMAPFAVALSAQDMRDVGAYFATQKAGAGVADDSVIEDGPNQGLKFYQVGERLFRGGDAKRGIPACMACHGPAGDGNPGPAYPHVGGQQADYVVRRLEEYRTGATDAEDPALFNIMASVAKSLTDEEIRSLGSYLNGLHPRHADTAAAAATAEASPAADAGTDTERQPAAAADTAAAQAPATAAAAEPASERQ